MLQRYLAVSTKTLPRDSKVEFSVISSKVFPPHPQTGVNRNWVSSRLPPVRYSDTVMWKGSKLVLHRGTFFRWIPPASYFLPTKKPERLNSFWQIVLHFTYQRQRQRNGDEVRQKTRRIGEGVVRSIRQHVFCQTARFCSTAIRNQGGCGYGNTNQLKICNCSW